MRSLTAPPPGPFYTDGPYYTAGEDGAFNKLLATVDPETGAITVIAPLEHFYTGLALSPEGDLFGVAAILLALTLVNGPGVLDRAL